MRKNDSVKNVISSLLIGLMVIVNAGIWARSVWADTMISAKALNDHECKTTEWHFVINQISSESLAPASILVRWSNGSSETVTLDKFTGGVAHYTTYSHLDSTVISAEASIYDGWSGQFNLSHGPCGQPDVTPTPTKTPTITMTPKPTTTPTVILTVTPTPTVTPGDEVTPTPTGTPGATPTVTLTPTAGPTPTPTPTGQPGPTATPKPEDKKDDERGGGDVLGAVTDDDKPGQILGYAATGSVQKELEQLFVMAGMGMMVAGVKAIRYAKENA